MPQPDRLLPRLGFRLMEEHALADLTALDTEPDVRAHFPDGISSASEIRERVRRNRESFAQRGYCDFTVIHRQVGRFAGRAGFGDIEGGEIEVGYVFRKEFRGQGLAQEALRSLLDWARDNTPAKRILACAPATHSASLNVMARSGMAYLKTDRLTWAE